MTPKEILSKHWKFTDDSGNQVLRKPWKYDPATKKYIFIVEEKGKTKFLTVGVEWFKGRESQIVKRAEE